MKIWYLSLLLFFPNSLQAQTPGNTSPNISLEQILDKMMARNDWQSSMLLEFRALRKFYAANPRFKTDSTMHVETTFKRPDELQSTVKSQEGSRLIRSRVFDKILEAENETRSKKARQQVDITPDNYNFGLIGTEECDGRACFHLTISPKRRDKYSLDGEVWVDAEDYSIVRIHGSPAKRPSFWTLRTEIDRRYQKIEGIWLPVRMDSSSNIMIAGQSVLSIEYSYQSVQTATGDR
jgi:outer membrane lipoprotein-sorting protein